MSLTADLIAPFMEEVTTPEKHDEVTPDAEQQRVFGYLSSQGWGEWNP